MDLLAFFRSYQGSCPVVQGAQLITELLMVQIRRCHQHVSARGWHMHADAGGLAFDLLFDKNDALCRFGVQYAG